MATPGSPAHSGGGGDGEIVSRAGFAKLQGEDFYFYMQKYSILIGRGGSRRTNVDVDLGRVGGGTNVSRVHARIFYDFPRRRFALEVIGKNGCYVEGVHHPPGSPPVKLDSQDLLQMGEKKFYFLLPIRSVIGGAYAPRRGPLANPPAPTPRQMQQLLPAPRLSEGDVSPPSTDDDDDHDQEKGGSAGDGAGAASPAAEAGASGGQPEERSVTNNKEEEEKRALQLEESEVISCVATAISDLCGHGEWVPVKKLHSVLLERFCEKWQPNRVKRYLTSEGVGPSSKTDTREWAGLLVLMRKHPENFVIHTTSRGNKKKVLVSLVSLLQ
ncbi:hypothetical protein Taro_028429 [Colocasia esculenta]|uniref:FHA domain-containing protein n=1 Tax=Colocasia esculenta TaxID=4460 RepID=A0A843VN50_COLES|nr:hypothetical protein [Colocasia esculenta]